MSRARMVSNAWSGPVTALLVTVALSTFASPALAKSRETPESGDRCYRDNFDGRRLNGAFENISASELQGIATDCYNKAADRTKPTGQTIYANFYAGKAWRIIGTANNLPASDRTWRSAEQALRLVVAFHDPNDERNPEPLTARSAPSDLRAELTRIEAEVELAQVLAAQGRRVDAEQLAGKAISEYGAFSRFPAIPAYPSFLERANADSDNASYVQSRILRTPPAKKTDAVVSLYAFLNPRTDRHPRSTEARNDLYDMATEVGLGILDQSGGRGPGTAGTYFTAALGAAGAEYKVRPTPELARRIADANINLGRVNLMQAGRLGPDEPGGCLSGVTDLASVNGAATLFEAASHTTDPAQRAKALRWLGCAQQAGNRLEEALNSAQAAIRDAPRSADAQLALARVSAAVAKERSDTALWGSSRSAYKQALSLMAAARATTQDIDDVKIEYANSALEYVRVTPRAPDAQQVVRDATTALNDANRPGSVINAEAYLRLGTIQIGDDSFGNQRNWDAARTNLILARDNALERQEIRYEAQYQLSRLATQKILAARRPTNRGGISTGSEALKRARIDAVSSGADAATHADALRAPEYYRQACDARLLSGDTSSGDDQYCVFSESRARDTNEQPYNSAEAWLRQGMYQLSRGSNSRTPKTRSDAWDAAIIAFDNGALRLGSQDFSSDSAPYSQHDDLLGKLLTGKGVVLNCNHLSQVGRAVTDRIPTGLYNQLLVEYFERDYDLNRCQPR